MRAPAERHPGEAMAVALSLLGEAHRIEFFRLHRYPQGLGEQRMDADHGAGGVANPLLVKSRTACRGIDGTGGFSRNAS
jgi:hypothetical protein